jgi:Tol biopolymer transport system component
VATDEGIVFTSDRGGKPEAYLLHQGETERLTHTPGSGQSWTGEE